MKILSIAGRNLNSLRAEFSVDFTSGALKDCGIFVITGPTGAGKTTLLDAITLALYGKTPRVARDIDIISYGSSEAQASVVFQTSEGIFKSEWKVRRAYSKHDGTLQQSTMEVSTLPDKKILTQKKREALDKVKDLIKLEYDQFLKSVLLAQGAFKAFLDAGEGERGEMLEKISDTSLYTSLSRKAFERKRKEERALELLQVAHGNVVLLSEEERVACENCMQELLESVGDQQLEFAVLRVSYNWLQLIEDLTKKQQEAEDQVVMARQQLETERPNLLRWESHLQVAGLEPEWIQYLHKMQECLSQKQKIARLDVRLSSLTNKRETAESALATARELAEKAVKLREERMPAILEALTRQRDMLPIKEELEGIRKKYRAKTQEETACTKKISDSHVSLSKNTLLLEELSIWLSQYSYYAEAGTSCTEASLLAGDLKRSLQDTEVFQAAIFSGEKHLTQAKELLLKAASIEQEAVNDLQSNQDVRNKTSLQLCTLKKHALTQLQEVRLLLQNTSTDIDTQQDLFSRQKFLADHLSRLHPGESCPLCGSTEHPNQTLSVAELGAEIKPIQAEIRKLRLSLETNEQRQRTLEKFIGNLDDFDELTGVDTAPIPPNLEAVYNELLQLWKALPLKQHEISHKLASAKQSQKNLAENIAHFEGEKVRSLEKLQHAQDANARYVQRLGEIANEFQIKFDAATPGNLPNALKKYAAEYQQKSNEASILNVVIPGTQAATVALQEQISGIQQDLLQLQSMGGDKRRLIDQYETNIREAHLGHASPEAARDTLNADEKAAIDRVTQAGEQFNAILQETGKILGEKNNAGTACSELELSINNAKTNLQASLQVLGLEPDTDLIQQKLLTGNERVAMEKLQKMLQEKLVLSLAQCDTCKKQLDHQISLAITQENIETVEGKIKHVQETINDINQELGRMRQILKEDDEKNARLKDVRLKIEAQQLVLRKWAALSDLIGSADGKRFNQFAQGLTLDRLILLANHHLQLLNDRYLLKRNTGEQGLRLLVIDLYQAANEREINTLSGGESFLVSLALALGLSEMTSKLTTIDSLFIDEGFGTLDADTLEVALNALRSLQINGKTIGIISHVERLKEEIYTQVEITKGSDGFSTLKVIP